jgi:hypothetical protein
MEKDEIIFSGAYKGFRLGVRFDLTGKAESDAAYCLAYIGSRIDGPAYAFSGIDTEKIAALAKPSGRGVSAVAEFLSKTPRLKKALASALPKIEAMGNEDAENPEEAAGSTEPGSVLMPAAESYLLSQLLKNAGVGVYPELSSEMKPEPEEASDVIAFIGKYRNWIAIKKLGLDGVKDYHVGGILAGVNYTLVNKAYDFLGAKADEGLVREASGKRKTLSNLAAMLGGIAPRLPSGNDGTRTLLKCMEETGYHPYATLFMLVKAYPELKPRKPRGRLPKG